MAEVPACAAGVPFLRALPDDALAELGRSMRHRHVEHGQVLALAGEPIEHLVVVARGRLRLTQASAGGREQVLRTLGPGEFLGELALFSPAAHESLSRRLRTLEAAGVLRHERAPTVVILDPVRLRQLADG